MSLNIKLNKNKRFIENNKYKQATHTKEGRNRDIQPENIKHKQQKQLTLALEITTGDVPFITLFVMPL